MPQDFKGLAVWKLSFEFVKEVYRILPSFPKEELYGMNSQLRRAVISISSNIAEGTGKKSNRDFANFLYISLGSCKEVESLLLLSKDLGYISQTKFNELNEKLDHIGRMLTNLIKSIEAKED